MKKALETEKMSGMKTYEITICGLFATLIAVGAFIRIPIPVVPFTLQFLFTTLAGLLLGPYRGAGAVVAYILLGLMGLPVFAGGCGPGYVLQPTFGYLVGFAIGAYITGKIAEGKSELRNLVIASVAGLVAVYACGMLYFYFINNWYLGTEVGIKALFIYCFVMAVPGDIFLCLVAAYLGKRIKPALKNIEGRVK